jgi:hypothetical protein
MQSVIRETMVTALIEVSALTARYARTDPLYVQEVSRWLETTETSLGKLRHPAAGFVAARRGLLEATADGHRPDGVEAGQARRVRRAAAAMTVAEVEARLGDEVTRLDATLAEWQERMSQLVAVAAPHTEFPAPREPREAWLMEVWRALDVGNGAQGMFEYLSARLGRTDRLYVLDQIMANVLEAAA